MSSKPTDSGGETGRDIFTPGRIVFLIVAAVTLIFIFQNNQQTEIRLLIPQVTLPLWTALLFTLLVGTGCGYYLAARRRRRRDR